VFVGAGFGGGDGGVEAVEDEEVAVGVVHGWEGGYALDVVERGEGVHLVVVEFVPGYVPAGVVLLDALVEVEGAEVVVDGGKAGHEGEVGAGDGEDEVGVGGVGEDDALDAVGGGLEGVFRVQDEVELLNGVRDDDGEDDCGCEQ